MKRGGRVQKRKMNKWAMAVKQVAAQWKKSGKESCSLKNPSFVKSVRTYYNR